jgi:hypothetical protein
MHKLTSPSFLNIGWKTVVETIRKLGLHENTDSNAVSFLNEIGLVTSDSGINKLTKTGEQVFRHMFVLNDEQTAAQLIAQSLWAHPVVHLIGQVFFGRGSISKQQLLHLLIHHHILTADAQTADDLGTFLTLLNRFHIVRYDRKSGTFVVEPPSIPITPLTNYFVDETTPYSNILHLKKILRSLKGHVYWLDKHFRKEGLEFVVDSADGRNISSFTIVSGPDNVTSSAKTDFMRAQVELNQRNISLQWYVCNEQSFLSKWHDRWLLGDNLVYNIPPVLSLIKGQQSELLLTENRPNITKFLEVCDTHL